MKSQTVKILSSIFLIVIISAVGFLIIPRVICWVKNCSDTTSNGNSNTQAGGNPNTRPNGNPNTKPDDNTNTAADDEDDGKLKPDDDDKKPKPEPNNKKPKPEPEVVEPLTTDPNAAKVQLIKSEVWVSSPEIPLFGNLKLGGRLRVVKVKKDGQAVILIGNKRSIYVFLRSGIQASKCDKNRGGNAFCLQTGVSLVNSHGIKKDIETGSVIITPKGTLFAVAYFPKGEYPDLDNETIIFVFDKKVEVKTFKKENPKNKDDFGKTLEISENNFVISKSSKTKGQTAGYNEQEAIPIPTDYNEEIERLYERFDFGKWIIPLNDQIMEIGKKENIDVRVLPRPTLTPKPTDNSSPIINNKIDFGEIYNTGFIDKEYVFKNEINTKNSIPIQIRNIEIMNGSSPVSGDFEIIQNECQLKSILNNDEQCNFKVRFNPKRLGSHSASLIIMQNTDDVLQIELSGESTIEPNTKVTTSNNGKETFDPQRIKTGKDEKSIDIIIDGPRKVIFSDSDFTITGEGKENFEITDRSTCTTKGGVKGKCSVIVSFKPLTTGEKKAFLEVKGKKAELNGSPGDKTSLLLTKTELLGTGAVPKFTADLDDENRLCFKRETKVAKGSDKIRAEDAITITNTGSIPITITNDQIVQKEIDFWIKDNNCNNVAPGNTCKITIAFSPKKRKRRIGNYTIQDKDYDGNTEETVITSKIQGVGKPHNPISRIFYKVRGYWILPCPNVK